MKRFVPLDCLPWCSRLQRASAPVWRVACAGLGLVVLALAGGGCGRSGGAPKAASAPAIPVQTAIARKMDVPRALESVGAVQALRTVAVKSQVDGMIAEIHFREGDEVKAGDLLVSLDQRPFENALRIARADLVNARAEAQKAATDAERYTRLDQQDAISKEQFAQLMTKAETTKASVQSKEASVANAELQLSYTQIRAPIAGRTGQLLLHEGALVKANDNNFSIVTLNQLMPIAVAYAVPENSLEEVRAALTGHQAKVIATERSSGLKRDDGQLQFIDNAVDATTGMITLKAVFPNTDQAFWPGQFVTIVTQFGVDHDAIVVPSTAVQTSQHGSTVYVVKPDHTVELRDVKITRTAGDTMLLGEGVQAGDTVVTDGQLRLLPGVKVEAKTLVEAANAAPEPKKT
jgi:membrane fusion protein, multidrug efflux system